MNDKTPEPDAPSVVEPRIAAPEPLMLNIDRALRGPLTQMQASIRGLGRIYLDDDVLMSPRQRDVAAREIARLKQIAFRYLRLSNNIRDMARFQRGEDVIEPRWINFSALCEQVQEQAGLAARPDSVLLQTPETPVWLNGDAAQLERVLYNLIANALLSRDGEEPVRCVLAADGRRASLRVEGGRGIPDHILGQYDIYGQEPDLDGPPDAGLSLGLPLCKYIMERHQGVLLPASGRPSAVTMALPLGEPDPDESHMLFQPMAEPGFPISHIELSCLPLGGALYRE